MTAELIVIFILPVLFALAAGWDLASFTIPNFLSAALVAVFVVFIFASAMPIAGIGWHLLAGMLGLGFGFTLFALGYIGGGDAKLFAATALWFGFGHDLLDYALVASVLGGALTLFLLGLRRVPLPALLLEQGWILRLHDARAGVPYGVALAAGAVIILPHTEIFTAASRLAL